MDFTHSPVMVDQIVDLFAPVPPGTVIDGTVGGGGHAAALLAAHPHLSVLGLDRDPVAVEAARLRLAPFGRRATIVRSSFDRMADAAAGVAGPITGVLLDLGVSSPQLDVASRGFSFRHGGPLDMRMDPDQSLSAAEVVNDYTTEQLVALLAAHGEARLGRRIARAIVAARPIVDTAQLADVVAAAVPAPARRRGHPARRVFQAIRAEVNDEQQMLAAALDAVPAILAVGGRCCVLSYHSGEDRAVKAAFVNWATGGCTCPPGLPCVCGAQPTARLLNRGARIPSKEEVMANPRAEAARLRAIEWTGGAE